MLPLFVLPLATLAAASIISPGPSAHPLLTSRQSASVVTEQFVSDLDLYAEYALAAYCNSDATVGEPVICQGGCPHVQQDKAIIVHDFVGATTGIGAYVAKVDSRKQIVVSVRGSSNGLNWLTNFRFFEKDSDLAPNARVHIGFNSAWSELSNGVLDAVQKVKDQHPDYHVIATGHSLGGAVATLAAAYLRRAGHIVDLYTYGSPRVGNGVLVDFITNQPGLENRVTNNLDPVPRLPPSKIIPQEYRHVSPEYWLHGHPANPSKYPPADIKVCPGNNNHDCNGSTLKFDILDDLIYLGLMVCRQKGDTVSKIKESYQMSEAELVHLESLLTEWVAMDTETD